MLIRTPIGLLVLLLLAWSTGCSKDAAVSPPSVSQASLPETSALAPNVLSLDDVFVNWRGRYGDLIGKAKDAAVERFGKTFTEETPGLLSWSPRVETDGRRVDVGLTAEGPTGIIFLIKVYVTPTETLDPLDILKKSPLFRFESGTYSDSATKFFIATTQDGRNGFQFDVSDSAVAFQAAILEDPGLREQSRRR